LYPGDLFFGGVHLKLLLYSSGVNQPSFLMAKNHPKVKEERGLQNLIKNKKKKRKRKRRKSYLVSDIVLDCYTMI
jgi:hypothetical protein